MIKPKPEAAISRPRPKFPAVEHVLRELHLSDVGRADRERGETSADEDGEQRRRAHETGTLAQVGQMSARRGPLRLQHRSACGRSGMPRRRT